MRKIVLCLLTLFALSTATATAFAGAGHSHGPSTPITKQEALEKAADVVKNLVAKGKIDASWAVVTPASGEQKKSSFGPEWVVAFNNPKITDSAKQTLYVFFTLEGKYKAANYTGS